MKTRIDKNFGVTGTKVELNLPDLYLLKNFSSRMENFREHYREFESEEAALVEAKDIIYLMNIFIKKLTKGIEAPQESNIFEEDKEDEIVS